MTDQEARDEREALTEKVAKAIYELRQLSDAARPGPWKAYETMQADNFIVEESQGLFRGPGPVMGPSYDKSTVEYVVALVNAHRAGWIPPAPEVTDEVADSLIDAVWGAPTRHVARERLREVLGAHESKKEN